MQDNPTQNATQKTPAWKWALRLVIGVILVGLLLSRREIALGFWNALRDVSPLVFAASVLFYLAGQAISAWKWQILIRARVAQSGAQKDGAQKNGAQISWADCFRFYLAGMFGNLWLPTNIGGDALRTALLKQRIPELGLSGAATSVLVERLTGFAALLLLALGALVGRALFSSQAIGAQAIGALEIQILLGTGAVFALLGVLFFLARRLKHRKFVAAREALGFYLQPQQRGILALAIANSFAFQISQILLNYFLARAVGLEVPFWAFWWIGPLLSLSGLLPISIGGLGVREGAALALMSGFAVSSGEVVAWSILWQATVWAASLPGLFFVRRPQNSE